MNMDQKNIITRLFSLDVFRGLTIALMILVNSPGNCVVYAWLEHSTWNGCTLADLVFPFFIVIVGMSSVLALTNLKKKL
jgi:predicted acyltransferase